MTLIEVLASLAILGSVLVGVVLAKSRHQRQGAEALQRIEACWLADQLLQTWWSRPAGIPLKDSGSFQDRPDWRWETSLLGETKLVHDQTRHAEKTDEASVSPDYLIVRLEVINNDQLVLASAELLVQDRRNQDNAQQSVSLSP